jgi:hypothetical protein
MRHIMGCAKVHLLLRKILLLLMVCHSVAAGTDGKDILVNNVNLAFKKLCSKIELSMHSTFSFANYYFVCFSLKVLLIIFAHSESFDSLLALHGRQIFFQGGGGGGGGYFVQLNF